VVATVFAVLPRTAIDYGVALGVERAELLAATGLTESDLEDPDNLVPYASLLSIWRLYTARFPGVPVGLNYGRLARVELFGVVGQACVNAPTLADALEIYFRYQRLIDPFARTFVAHGAERTIVTLDHEPMALALPEAMEMLLTSACAIGRQLADQFERPLVVRFRHERRNALVHYEEYFGCEVAFGDDVYGLEYPLADLTVAPRGANPAAGRYLERLAGEVYKTIIGEAELADHWLERVRRGIEASLDHGEIKEGHVARRLGTSTRSLQRALRERSTSFFELLTDVRRSRSLALLRRPELSAAEVAFMLGYSDARSFYRSFRQWHGVSPGQYRKDIGAR